MYFFEKQDAILCESGIKKEITIKIKKINSDESTTYQNV